ncbi:hypothetical protein A4R35_09855 [Thermogemmatispora tikiterensis]|uniref:Uncharacterized protein n=1 Tax=Thermogemmatispora tikiterensis TaxID=1825093 RepID=A0A328VJ86_9CHLR|nr:hypothetical protein A4R35_09855 [Thermogemmatispora tikiterensis]
MHLSWLPGSATLASAEGQHLGLTLIEIEATDTFEDIVTRLPCAVPALLVQFPGTGPLVEDQELLLQRCQASAERLAVLLPPEQLHPWGASAYRVGVPFACTRERALALLGLEDGAFPRSETGQETQLLPAEHQCQPGSFQPRLLWAGCFSNRWICLLNLLWCGGCLLGLVLLLIHPILLLPGSGKP